MRTLISTTTALLVLTTFSWADDPPTRSLGRVFAKLEAGQPVTVAYFGGSITAAPGYRVNVTKWLQERFPKAQVREVNAAIGGTGSDLGAFRCGVDVIAQQLDLVFVEFNINDGSPVDDFHKATMEGIVRQLWSSKSQPEIVFLYTTSRKLNERRGSHPAVAKHYGIPEIDLQPPLVEALKRTDLPKPTEEQLHDPKLDWNEPGQVFMSDSVHPNALGHSIYTDTIVGYLKTQIGKEAGPPPGLPAPLISEEFANVALVPPSQAKLSGEWEVIPPTDKGRYRHGTINARQPGDAFEYTFDGTGIALFLNVQKDGGKFKWTVDQKGDGSAAKSGVVDTAPGPYFPRNHYAMLTNGLEPGKHVFRLEVLPEHDKTSTGNRLLIGYIMVAGVPQ